MSRYIVRFNPHRCFGYGAPGGHNTRRQWAVVCTHGMVSGTRCCVCVRRLRFTHWHDNATRRQRISRRMAIPQSAHALAESFEARKKIALLLLPLLLLLLLLLLLVKKKMGGGRGESANRFAIFHSNPSFVYRRT